MNLDERAYYLERHKRKKWRKPMPKQEFEQPTPVPDTPVNESPVKRERLVRYPLNKPWAEIKGDRFRIGALIEHVMEWEIFVVWHDFAFKYERPVNSGQWLITPKPAAVATSQYPITWRIFAPDHEFLHFEFDPLHDRATAKLVMQHIHEGKGPRLVRFAANLLHEPIEAVDGELPWLYWFDISGRPWTPEQICEAAYEAMRAEQMSETEG